MAVHKRLNNLVEEASFVDKSMAELAEIGAADKHRPPPFRDGWFKTVRGVDYKERLPEIKGDIALCTGGSGLGLAIVKQLVEAHGGQAQVESQVGGGTRFRLYFPRV